MTNVGLVVCSYTTKKSFIAAFLWQCLKKNHYRQPIVKRPILALLKTLV